MTENRNNLFETVLKSPRSYSSCFSSSLPRLSPGSKLPYARPLGPTSYDGVVGPNNMFSIGNTQAHRPSSVFRSEQKRFKPDPLSETIPLGPGNYDPHLPSVGETHDPEKPSSVFASRVSRKKSLALDTREMTWSPERDRKMFWKDHSPRWTKTDRYKQGPKLPGDVHNMQICAPDKFYDVSFSVPINKYTPIAVAAGYTTFHDEKLISLTEKLKPNQQSKIRTEIRRAMKPPLDLSFNEISTPEDIVQTIEEMKESQQSSSLTPLKSIRLNNNTLKTTQGIEDALCSSIAHEIELDWLDLSFNCIKSLEPFEKFSRLIMLNLHANQISKLSEINKLRSLTQLKSITLYGNPIQAKATYRLHILAIIPSLKKIDGVVVTTQERDAAQRLLQSYVAHPQTARSKIASPRNKLTPR